MDEAVRVVTELQLRREALELDRTMLVARLQLRCEHGAEGLDPRSLRDWEQRLHAPSALYQALLCDYFQVDSIAELGLGTTLEAARYWTWRTKPERTREVRRRQLLRVSVQAATASLFPVPPLVAAAQILGGRRRLDSVDLDAAQQVATHLAASYAASPDRDTLGAAQAHAYTLLDLLKRASMTPGNRTRLAALASDAVSLAGYTELNAGRYTQADRWFATALRLARDAKDRRLEAYALACHAWVFVDGPNPDRAAAIAALEAAAELQGALPPAGRAWLFGYLADQGAAAGDDLTSGRLLERARIAATAILRHDAGWGCWSTHGELSGWDGARADVFAGARSLRLGRPAEAVELLERALGGTTRPVRRAAVYETLTEASVALGDPDRACASAAAALDETPGLGLGIDTLRKIRKTFPKQWATLAPVIELDERLDTA
jgi:tetratricopeptide (TPR) repeat protein